MRAPQVQDTLLGLIVAEDSAPMPPMLTQPDMLCADRRCTVSGRAGPGGTCLPCGGSHASCGTGKFSRAAASQTPSCDSQIERSPIGPSVVV